MNKTITESDLQAHIDSCRWCREHPNETCKVFDSLLYRARTQPKPREVS